MSLAARLGKVALAAGVLAGGVSAAAMDVVGGAGGSYSLPVVSQKAARFKATIKQQFDFSCGSAALATLLTYHYGRPTTEQSAFAEMFARGDQQKIRAEGFSLLDMKRYLAAHGFEADGFELPLEKLGEAHVPAIVLVTDNGYNHFVVVKGLRAGRVLVGDPATGTRLISREHFDAIWKNRLLFVIHNEEDLASFNNDSDWRMVPMAPLATGILRDSLDNLVLPRLGVNEL